MQNARRALAAADSACIIRTGRIADRGPARHFAARDDLFESFLGTDPANPVEGPMP